MNTDILDLFLNQLGLASDDRQKLKGQIALFTFDRAALLLRNELTSDEQTLVANFLAKPDSDTQAQVQQVFATPERQSVLTTSFLAVLEDLIDDPEVVDLEKRDIILGEMEQFLESKQALL